MDILQPFLATWPSSQSASLLSLLQSSPHIEEALQRYIKLLQQWNRKVRLTGKDDPHSLAGHIADSLVACEWLQQHRPSLNRALDIGSGAGFPAIPLSLVFPETHWTLLESRQRRASFLRYTCQQLKLHAEVKTLFFSEENQQDLPHQHYDLITFRAVAPQKILSTVQKVLHPEGYLLYWGTPQSQAFPSPFQRVDCLNYSLAQQEQLQLQVYKITTS